MKEFYLLRPDITFLNHGSFGACPRPVFEAYQQWQYEMEAQPVEFLSRRIEEVMHAARAKLAAYVGTQADSLVFVTNATTGVNIVARSLKLKAGDEILATDHEYGAIDRTWRFLCGQSGAVYVRRPMSLPLTTAEDFVERFWQGVTARTKVISLSHITSPTAVIFPLQEICRRARAAGILTIIDGAHAPGQIPLNLDELGADFYAGNCHKWLSAPKGAAFLYARPEVQNLVEPLVVSWGYESVRPGTSRYVDWLEWQGTRDYPAFLAVSAAIDFQAQHNWETIRQQCHLLVTEARQKIDALTNLAPIYPDASWYAQMATIRLPTCDTVKVQKRLWDDYKIEIPLINWNNQAFVRISVQAYNTKHDIEQLLGALQDIL